MSNLVRRIEKRIMKAAGMRKQEFTHENPDDPGNTLKFTLVVDESGANYGADWPHVIPRKFSAPPRNDAPDVVARIRREDRNIVRTDIHEA